MTVTAILSIQSSVAYGHAGNSAATFPLMRLGVEVWPVLTVHFSNHTGYESWAGPMLSPDDVAAVVHGIDARGVLARCDAVLSGYQGAPEMGRTILGAVHLVKRRNPAALYCCDPVMGDVGRGIYVHEGIPELMRDEVLPAADIATPNHFELDLLTQRETATLAEVLDAVQQLRAMGPETVLVTSVLHDEAQPGTVEMLAVNETQAWRVVTPLIGHSYSGTGDVTTACFLAAILAGEQLGEALGHTAARIYGLLDATAAAGSTELLLAQAQEEFVSPRHVFTAERIS